MELIATLFFAYVAYVILGSLVALYVDLRRAMRK